MSICQQCIDEGRIYNWPDDTCCHNREETFDPSPSLDERVAELENLLEFEHKLIDALTDTFNKVLDSNQELADSTRKLCAATHELIKITKRRQEP